jgi:NAD(P)-dependent dehydrogenase (short-subunit alcohol dehydrogenase family)
MIEKRRPPHANPRTRLKLRRPSRAHSRGKIVLVTGGSGSIGSAICRLAASRGYVVLVHYFKGKSRASKVVADIRSKGQHAYPFRANLRSRTGVRQLFQRIAKDFGRLDALVNNASTRARETYGLAVSPTRIRTTVALNILAPFFCIQEAIPLMRANAPPLRGAIVNISSFSARSSGARIHIDYAAAKAALETLTVGFGKELASEGIRVNAVSPGTIKGGMSSPLIGERLESTKGRIPMQRLGTPVEVARSVLWLLSREASYITGAVLSVAGGR